jgi:Flp pilus assembly protein TadD
MKWVRLALGAACLMWLAGCETTSKLSDPLAPQASATADSQPTGSVDKKGPPPVSPELLGTDPNDDLNIGKNYFRQGSYGLAERHFRKAVELHPRDGEAWVGLAASYDRLKRFDLADRAYAQAIRILGTTPELLNNQGFSYLIRGDYRRARATLLAAQSQAPDNPFIKNNLRLLQESERKGKSVR